MFEIDKKVIEELREKVGYTFEKSRMKDAQGRFWTQGLFNEMSYGKSRNCIMTLKTEDYGGLPSFRRIFVELEDLSCYLPAMVLFGSWEHWVKLCDCLWFQMELNDAINELEVKLKSELLAKIKEIAEGNSKSALSAAKYLASGSWNSLRTNGSNASSSKKGPKSWEHKNKEKKIVSLIQRETNQDYKRLGLGETE